MKVGFTGSRKQMWCDQHRLLCQWLRDHLDEISEFRHGCCVGCDQEAVEAMTSIGYGRSIRIVGHPPSNQSMVSVQALDGSEHLEPRLPYLLRNQKIVESVDILLACPKEDCEELRSGTWATIRRAVKAGKPVVIFYPGGSVERRPETKRGFV